VDDAAARRLITDEQLVDALLWARDERELADELWVDVQTVRARLTGLNEREKNAIEARIAEREGAA
jgi:hypothetical protein